MIESASKHSSSGRLKQTKEGFLLTFRLHPFPKTAITKRLLLLSRNGLHHRVPHMILHLMYWLLRLNNGGKEDTNRP